MPSIINAATSGGLISTADTSGVLQLQTASTTALTINASQNVGIGQTTPLFPLHITGASGVNTYATFSNATTGSTATDGFSIGVANGDSNAYIIQREAASLIFYTNATEAMRVDSSGRLGVGTTDPGSYGKIASVGTNTSSALLAVRDEGTSTGNLFVVSSNAAGTIARINANGIGLGGATPSSGMGITFPATQSASSDANTLDDYEEGVWNGTVSAQDGTITSSTFSDGRYTKVGRLVTVSARLVIGNAGTGTGSIRITLPFTPASNFWAGSGVENVTGGYVLAVFGTLNQLNIRKYDYATAIVNNHQFYFTATYDV